MLRGRGRGPVAAGQHLAATGHAGEHSRGRGLDHRGERLGALVFQVGAVDELLLDTLQKHGAIIAAGRVSKGSGRIKSGAQPFKPNRWCGRVWALTGRGRPTVHQHHVETAWGL
ncbi:hypothetical protein FQZ97_966120 [compost metagenome]